MSISETLVCLFAPHICVDCGSEADRLLCDGCVQSLPIVPSRCYRCKAVTIDYAVCRACTQHTPLRQVLAYTFHHGAAKELVHRMKYERARAGTQEIARLLAELLPLIIDETVVLTHLPTATGRVRQRGYDHARLIARGLAGGELEYATLLARVGQAHQVGSGRSARLRQLEGAFRPVRPELMRDRHVVLVDDVLTTGATLESAARVLKRAGAKRVSAIVFAQV